MARTPKPLAKSLDEALALERQARELVAKFRREQAEAEAKKTAEAVERIGKLAVKFGLHQLDHGALEALFSSAKQKAPETDVAPAQSEHVAEVLE